MTPKQELFAVEYLKDLNASQAARRAGYAHPQVQGSQLLAHPAIKALIDAELETRSERVRADADWVIRRLELEAQNPANGATTRVRALELLGRHLGIFVPEKYEVSLQERFLFADL